MQEINFLIYHLFYEHIRVLFIHLLMYGLGSHLEIFRGYSCLHSEISFTGSGEQIGMLGIEYRSTVCKENALFIVL